LLSPEESKAIRASEKERLPQIIEEMRRVAKDYAPRADAGLLGPRSWEAYDRIVDFLQFYDWADNFHSWKRQRRLRDATPEWANEPKIDDIYAECKRRNLLAGYMAYHVDHVVPLQGKKVSGLHVPGNLRIISARKNLAKHNKFDVK
jgi:hypothetical protein